MGVNCGVVELVKKGALRLYRRGKNAGGEHGRKSTYTKVISDVQIEGGRTSHVMKE